ncbi:Cyclin N-terminal domain-containing protein 2 [Amphibalanus amphitrite]|uniref:Cyclin N-terminal domain-containing protein 2 n=1 Tax=Amphibalanus amphitrite TaxID=1232801 RepID=A0A6A4VQL9_AMPAM|nr:Cyclin N-terminal domain-containing protein 2 [Amphibalanus amphitrite]
MEPDRKHCRLSVVLHYLRLTGGTLHLALALLDRVLADLSCPLDNLQLLGVACLWLAAKMEDPRLPSARQLLKLTMDGYALGSLLNMELLVVRVTDFRLLRVHPGAFVSLQLHRRRLTAGEQGARNKFSSQSRYQGLALCEQLSPAHVQRVLLRQLGRPLLPPPQSPASRLSQEY